MGLLVINEVEHGVEATLIMIIKLSDVNHPLVVYLSVLIKAALILICHVLIW